MKPGLAVLPLEVWTDIFVYPWITRQQLAKIVDQFKDRKFAEKLQFRLHDYGKQSLRCLKIAYRLSDKPKSSKYQLRKRKMPQRQTSLAIASHGFQSFKYGSVLLTPIYEDPEFPDSEMPKNITKFRQLTIGHLDDEVLNFLDKFKPLFTNIQLSIGIEETKWTTNVRILLNHLLPMLTSIQGIYCENDGIQLLEQHYPGTLALAKELDLSADPAFIPAYLNWLGSPLDFDVHGPRFLKTTIPSATIFAIINAVRQHFLAATTSASFVIFLQFYISESHRRVQEFHHENATTNEQLFVRNAVYEKPLFESNIHYVEIVRHPTGGDAKIKEWIEKRAYYKQMYTFDKRGYNVYDQADMQTISIAGPTLTIGHITKRAKARAKMQQTVKKKIHNCVKE